MGAPGSCSTMHFDSRRSRENPCGTPGAVAGTVGVPRVAIVGHHFARVLSHFAISVPPPHVVFIRLNRSVNVLMLLAKNS